MAQDLGDALWTFVNEYVDSFTKWDLLVFFSTNPDVAEGGASLSRYLGRSQAEVDEALHNLADGGLLEELSEGGDRQYRLSADTEVRRQVDQFVTNTRSRDVRLRVLTHLLKMGSR